jgi:hypothetical protein
LVLISTPNGTLTGLTLAPVKCTDNRSLIS